MFHRTKQRFEALAALLDDILAADPDDVLDADRGPAAPAHPHDRTVAIRVPRRAGSVIPREMHCLCPVTPAPAARLRAEPIDGPARIPG